MTADSFVLLALLFAAAGAGWFFARLTGRHRAGVPTPAGVHPEYFEGLDFLLNEEPDKAIEVFRRMADVDPETVETHFLLGNLFRRRGEVDRAILIHQNIYERGDLPRAQRNRALKELADDYLKAGLFDRAEDMFKRLSEKAGYEQTALEQLVRIYEQEREWEKAIAARSRLASVSGPGVSPEVAHYYCELAEKAIGDGDREKALDCLRRARDADRDSLRGTLMRARLASEEGDHKLSVRLYRNALSRDPAFAAIVLPLMRKSYQAMGDLQGFTDLLSALVEAQPRAKSGIAYAAIVDGEFDDPVTADCIDEFINANPLLTDLLEILRPSRGDGDTRQESVRRITRALQRLARRSPTYRCHTCGFSGQMLFWQCPTCKSWGSSRPLARFQFDASIS
jgi:lipopolysaccharide biosynthesis regulator YciM